MIPEDPVGAPSSVVVGVTTLQQFCADADSEILSGGGSLMPPHASPAECSDLTEFLHALDTTL